MIELNKLVGIALLSILTGCGKSAQYNMGKSDDIASRANYYKGDTDWAQDVEKKSTDGRFTFKSGDPKCNLFLYDVIHEVVGEAPSNTWHPHTASDWAGSRSIKNWENLGTSETWKPGDVIAKEIAYTNATGHCGIAINSTEVIAAGTRNVSQGTHNLTGGTVRRYTGY